jgi:hypothetical protein
MDIRTTAAIAAFGLASSVGVGALALTAFGPSVAAATAPSETPQQIPADATAPEVIVVEVPFETATTAPAARPYAQEEGQWEEAGGAHEHEEEEEDEDHD